MEFKGKLMNPTGKKKTGKKTNFGSDFLAHVWPPKILLVDFASARCYTLLQAIIVCNFKEN